MLYPGHSLEQILSFCRDVVGVFYSPSRQGFNFPNSVSMTKEQILFPEDWDFFYIECFTEIFNNSNNVNIKFYLTTITFYIIFFHAVFIATFETVIRIEYEILCNLPRLNTISIFSQEPGSCFTYLLKKTICNCCLKITRHGKVKYN